jgi:hypothetical protein
MDLRQHANATQVAFVHHHPIHATLPEAPKTKLRERGHFYPAQRGHSNRAHARPHPKATHNRGYVALMEACLVVLRGRPGTEDFTPPDICRVEIPDLWRIPDAIDRVRTLA